MEVIELGAAELARRIAAKELSAKEVLDAHVDRLAVVEPRIHSVTQPLYDQARRAAREADERQARGEELGPLHGVPVTIKECFYVAGTASTLGVNSHVNELFAQDGPLVARWRQAGAIVLGKTNVPQLMLMHESDNPVYGRTNNPWNLDRGPGGSSGGEAAAIAALGSPLGLANDLGGSIRQPAHSCGICGLKPSQGRLTNLGTRANLRGLESLDLQPGPMARSVEDVTLGFETLCRHVAGEEHDPAEIAMPPFDLQRQDVAGLRVGIITDDGYFPASPALQRGVREAAAVLADQGVQCEEFRVPNMPEAIRVYYGLFGASGGVHLRRFLGSSKSDWRVKRMFLLGRIPTAYRKFLSVIPRMVGQYRLAELIESTGLLSADKYWELTAWRADFRRDVFELMRSRGLDALLLPPHGLPALRHGSSIDLMPAGSYSYLANLLGSPAGVVPVTKVRDDEQSGRVASRDLTDRTAAACDTGSAGLPVGVQVLGHPWREDIVLALMRAIERAVASSTQITASSIAGLLPSDKSLPVPAV